MKTIELNGNHIMSLDDEDYPLMSRYRWWAYKSRNRYYAQARFPNGKPILAHRLIMAPRKNRLIDHIDGNGLNNTKENLRTCSMAQNNQNSANRKHNTSGYRGVVWNKKDKAFYSRIRANKKEHFLGIFACPKEAAKAYDKMAKKLHGEFAVLNFSEGRE